MCPTSEFRPSAPDPYPSIRRVGAYASAMREKESLPAEFAGDLASSVVPGAGPLLSRLVTAVAGEWSRNRSDAMKAAVRTSGLTRQDLAERIQEESQLLPLVTRLLYEAAMTGQGALLEAKGAAFGAAAVEPSRTSDYELILGGLRTFVGKTSESCVRRITDRCFINRTRRMRPKPTKPISFRRLDDSLVAFRCAKRLWGLR